MSGVILIIAGLLISLVLSFAFATVSYALRDYSRVRLAEEFEKSKKTRWLQTTLDQTGDLVFVTAAGRLVANLFVFLSIQHLLGDFGLRETVQDLVAIVTTGVGTIFCSVAIPHALADHEAERIITVAVRPLLIYRLMVLPITSMLHTIDGLVRPMLGNAGRTQSEQIEEEIEQEILSAVDEGAAEGVVDEQERALIQSAVTFVDTAVGDAMTERADVIGVPVNATVDQVREAIEQSGHSRLPVFEGTLDRIVGVLYARDLLRFLGDQSDFSLRKVMRPAWFVPETKTLGALLNEFRDRNAHFATVLDEYGGTAGVVTVEDLLERLVGKITSEHDPDDSELLTRLDDRTAEADARIYLDQLNRLLNLDLPEDAGYDTLGGFVSTTLGKIPSRGTSFDYGKSRFTVLDAEPQRVNRVKIEQTEPAAPQSPDASI